LRGHVTFASRCRPVVSKLRSGTLPSMPPSSDKSLSGRTFPTPYLSLIRTHWVMILLATAVAVGLLMRLQGIEWGLPAPAHPTFSYHPDEAPHLIIAQKMATEGAKPQDFMYGGTLYFRILDLFFPLGQVFEPVLKGLGSMGNAILFGRLFMTGLALLSIVLLYKAGALLFHPRVGAFAALLLALVPAHVVWSQRVRPDVLATFLAIVLFYLAVRLYRSERHTRKYLYGTALVAGLAVALRFPLALFAIPAGLAFLYRERKSGRNWTRALSPVMLSALFASIAYLLGSPQSVSDVHDLLAGLQIQWAFQSQDFPPAIGRGPGLFQYGWTMMVLAVGYPVLLFAVYGTFTGLRRRDFAAILVLSALLPYLLLTSFAAWVVVRYLVPIVPFVVLLAAYAANELLLHFPRRGVAVAAVGFAILWSTAISFAYTRMETGPNVRGLAANWARREIAPGTVVLRVVGYPGDFSSNLLAIHSLDTYTYSLKSDVEPVALLDFLKPRYVFIGSQYRDELQRLGQRYPDRHARMFYRALTSGSYALVHRIEKSPTLFGINLQFLFASADYRLVNPTIYVYKRVLKGD
jgi:hypothetical protein